MSEQDIIHVRPDEGQSQQPPASMVATPSVPDRYGHIEATVRAEVQARTALALARPRDWLDVRDRLLREARRPGFAAVAEYAIPRAGTTIRGPSIRMAEAAMRALGNIVVDVQVLREDEDARLIQVSVADLETNTVLRQAAVMRKVVERRRVTGAETIVGTRTGSDGQTLYLIRPGDGDLLMSQQALVSRLMRTLVLRLVPGDILDETLAECAKTRSAADAQDPDAARKRLADAFASLGVRPSELAAYLGHPLDTCTPAELEDLRRIWTALRDGEVTWRDVMSQAQRHQPDAAPDPAAAAREKVKEAVKRGPGRPRKTESEGPATATEAPEASDPGLKQAVDRWLAEVAARVPHLSHRDIEEAIQEVGQGRDVYALTPDERGRVWDIMMAREREAARASGETLVLR